MLTTCHSITSITGFDDSDGTVATGLTVGVDAFAQTLPQSVDGTLVQFDAVLAEGVLRLMAV